jgi:hypothetical protein
MDDSTFYRFLGLLDKHWAMGPRRWGQIATELNEWARRTTNPQQQQHGPLRHFTAQKLGTLCRDAIRRLSDP